LEREQYPKGYYPLVFVVNNNNNKF